MNVFRKCDLTMTILRVNSNKRRKLKGIIYREVNARAEDGTAPSTLLYAYIEADRALSRGNVLSRALNGIRVECSSSNPRLLNTFRTN